MIDFLLYLVVYAITFFIILMLSVPLLVKMGIIPKPNYHWRIRHLIDNFKSPIVIRAIECEVYGDTRYNIGGGWLLEAFIFIYEQYNDDSGWRLFEFTILDTITFKYKPSERWATKRTKDRNFSKRINGKWPDEEPGYDYLLMYYHGEYEHRSLEQQRLEAAIKTYYEASRETDKCPELMSSAGWVDGAAAKLMQDMYQAQSDMYSLVGIDYHGGHFDSLREEKDE